MHLYRISSNVTLYHLSIYYLIHNLRNRPLFLLISYWTPQTQTLYFCEPIRILSNIWLKARIIGYSSSLGTNYRALLTDSKILCKSHLLIPDVSSNTGWPTDWIYDLPKILTDLPRYMICMSIQSHGFMIFVKIVFFPFIDIL